MSFQTASAILRGKWLLDKAWAEQHMPLVMRLLKGEKVDFGTQKAAPRITAQKMAGYTLYSVTPYSKFGDIQGDNVAMIDIVGPVIKYGDICTYGAVEYSNLVNRIVSSGKFSGIILNVDGPGGEAYGTTMLGDAIREARSKMPVIGVVNDGIAASADMWIISAATEIYATKKTDQFGSIGVYTSVADWNGYFEKEGLKVRDIYAPQSTEKNKDYKDAIDGNEDPIKEDLRVLADSFINTIRENRAGKLTDESWAKGKMFYAPEAQRIGLIDGIMSMPDILARMDGLIEGKKNINKNNNTMAFEKTLKASGSENFQVAEGGFLLSEEQLNNIEAAISASETQLQTAQSELQTATDATAALNDSVETLTQEKETLVAKVEELSKAPSEPASTQKGKDDFPKKESPEYAHNQWADEMLG